MAIRIDTAISKKVPIAGIDYASRQASITISGEVSDRGQIDQEAARLFTFAEAIVDRQLGLVATPSASTIAPTSSNPPPSTSASRPTSRRSPSPVSPAQLRYLRQLLDREPEALPLILADHHVTSIDQLTARDASAVIDRLKSPSA